MIDRAAFKRDGALHVPAVLGAEAVAALRLQLSAQVEGRPGRRLRLPEPTLSLVRPLQNLAEQLMNRGVAFPVRAVLFDKTEDANWAVAWHQDRTVAVTERLAVEGFGPWSIKDGIQHVAPPISVLEGMTTLRLHLDDCGADNAPLVFASGSHNLGRIPATAAAAVAVRHKQVTCYAQAGDVWAYATPILHASAPTRSQRRRRVLQIDYAGDALPGGLTWLGVAS